MDTKYTVLFVLIPIILISCVVWSAPAQTYTPDWASLDSRPLPTWYDQSKFGIFVVWGVYSVPAYGSEWFWQRWQSGNPAYVKFMQDNYPPSFTYADFGKEFTAELFDPNEWADIFQASGARYIVFTTKHHDGYTNWPSKVSFNWNSMELGAGKDLVGLLASALRNRTDLHLGLYHSLFEWYHPLYLQDKKNQYKSQDFVREKTLPELYELVNSYKPDVIWSDGDWEAPYEYWNSTEFLAWLYNDSPVKDTVVVNDRWGAGVTCHHGGFYTCQDRYNPGKLVPHKWENCFTIDRASWGFRRDAALSDYLSTKEILNIMVETFSCGGNVLLNVGPTKDGRILPIFEERLRDVGKWLAVNGEAVYSSSPWKYQQDARTHDVWYTTRQDVRTDVYAFLQTWPRNGSLVLRSLDAQLDTRVFLLGYKGKERFGWVKHPQGGITVNIPAVPLQDIPGDWVWTLKFTNIR